MAEGSDMLSAKSAVADGALVDGIRSFVTGHAGAKAVIEYVGRRGARIVLVAEDGAWSDQFAGSTEEARQACQQAGVQIENEWERELVELMRPSNDLWRSMSRRSLAR
ncbi:MAG: hypothetical protein J2P15_11110 [Micromonosporaceae bacterium]|nr:hypothetical protein [Micromonosporaceae bacterium]